MDKKGEVLKHIRCRKGDIAPYVIIPGDPGRVKRIVDRMDDARLLAQNREYIVYTGTYKETPITVCSSTETITLADSAKSSIDSTSSGFIVGICKTAASISI